METLGGDTELRNTTYVANNTLIIDHPDSIGMEEHFIGYYELKNYSNTEILIKMLYFMFTSLSTVGFGDFCPRGNIERLMGAMLILFGVSIFSYIMNKFIEMSEQLIEINKDLDDEDNLSKFFGTLQNFNQNKSIKNELKEQIESHFRYKWRQDKVQAFVDEADLALFSELPEHIQHKLFRDFLFSKFIKTHRKYFTIEKSFSPIKYNFYNWNDQLYSSFMMKIMKSLEPRKEEREVILFNELDDFTEVLFFHKGKVKVGFHINHKQYFVLMKQKGFCIADHGCTFNHKSNFIYKTHTLCEGFFIRKASWHEIMEEENDITMQLKQYIIRSYLMKTQIKVQCMKKRIIKLIGNRSHFQQMMHLQDID